jgi:hypothetical protein
MYNTTVILPSQELVLLVLPQNNSELFTITKMKCRQTLMYELKQREHTEM